MKAQENPFIGVRAIEDKDRFFGRDHELRKLTSLLIAERIVLFYSPSGAGKTSLLKAGLIPNLKTQEFIVHPVMRVGKIVEWPDSTSAVGRNRYLKSALNDLGIAPPPPGAEFSEKEFSDYLKELPHNGNSPQPELFIFDQFEEILTRDPFDLDRKQEFFDQVGLALRDKHRWAVFAMREDYIAGLDPYLQYIPTHFATTFRLNLLSRDAAIEAIQKTAEAVQGKEGLSSLPTDVASSGGQTKPAYFFSYPAAEKLVNNLSEVLVPQAQAMAAGGGSSATRVRGQYVEPVHLQVVCKRLWKNLPDQTSEVKPQDIEVFGKVDESLEEFYSEEIKDIAGETKAGEQREIREWFDRRLITPEGLRTQVMLNDAETQQLGAQTVRKLLDSYLVRTDRRHEITWLELAHDCLIKPVRNNNQKWFKDNLQPLQQRAQAWEVERQSSSLLFAGAEWEAAKKWAEGKKLNDREKAFYAECEKAANAEQLKKRLLRIARGSLLLSCCLLVLVLAIVAGFTVRAGKLKSEVTRANSEVTKAKENVKEAELEANTVKEKAQKEAAEAALEKQKAQEEVAAARQDVMEARAQTATAEKDKRNLQVEQRKAEQARDGAVTARVEAENAQARAEEARVRAENDKREVEGERNQARNDAEDAKQSAARADALTASDRISAQARIRLRSDPKDAVMQLLGAIESLRSYALGSGGEVVKESVKNSLELANVKTSLQSRITELKEFLPTTLLDVTVSDCRENKPDCKPSNIQSIGFSADGQMLVTADDNGKAYKYNLDYKYTPDNSNFKKEIRISYQNEVRQIAVSPNKGHIAVGYLSGDIKIWPFGDSEGFPIRAFRYPVHQLRFAENERLLASASKFWTYSVGELELSGSRKAKRLYLKPGLLDWVWGVWIKARSNRLVNDFAFTSKAGSTLLIVARDDGQLEVREAISGKEVLTTQLFAKAKQKELEKKGQAAATSDIGSKPEDVLLNITTSTDGNWLATAGKGGNIYVWDIHNLWNKRNAKISLSTTLGVTSAVQRMAFSPGSNLLASVEQAGAIHLWKLEKSTWQDMSSIPFPGHAGTINALTFYTGPQNKLLQLATADSTGSTKIWHISQIEKLSGLGNLLRELGAENSANGDLEPLLKRVRQFLER